MNDYKASTNLILLFWLKKYDWMIHENLFA